MPGIPAAPSRQEGRSLDLSLNYSSAETLRACCEQSVSENPLRHHGPPGASLGLFFCFFCSALKKDCPDSPALPASSSKAGVSQRSPQLLALQLLGGMEVSPCSRTTLLPRREGGSFQKRVSVEQSDFKRRFHIILICQGLLRKLVSAFAWCGMICSSQEHLTPLQAPWWFVGRQTRWSGWKVRAFAVGFQREDTDCIW